MARKSRKNIDATAIEVMPTTYHAAGYLRLSSDDKKKRGDSLETQRAIIESFIAEYPDIKLSEIYIDNNLSGMNFERPGFLKMLADAESGKINCIIVKDLSRFGRNAVDACYYIEKHFPSIGVRFIAVTDSFDSNNGDGGILLPLKNVIAESYALDISRKCRAVHRQNIASGLYVGRLAPYGYSKNPQHSRKLIIDEETAPVVRQIFEWTIEGCNTNEIAKRLSEANIPPPSHRNHDKGFSTSEKLVGSRYWKSNAVRNILSDRVYVGDMVQGKTQTMNGRQIVVDPSQWVCVPNTHEPIISREVFEQVQAIRQRVYEKTQTHTSFGSYSPNIFRSKMFCEVCGYAMHRKRQNKDGVYGFHCDSQWKFGKDACVQVSVKESYVISELLKELSQYPEMLREKLNSARTVNQQESRADTSNDLREINRSLNKAERMLKSLYESLVSGLITQDEYTQMRAGYVTKIAEFSRQADEIRNERYEVKVRATEYRSLSEAATAAISSNDLTAELMDKLVEKIKVRPDKSIFITLKFMDELGEVRHCG